MIVSDDVADVRFKRLRLLPVSVELWVLDERQVFRKFKMGFEGISRTSRGNRFPSTRLRDVCRVFLPISAVCV